MAEKQITIIRGDAAQHPCKADLMLTDPPYELDGAKLAGIINAYDVQHLVLITTMRQLLQFMAAAGGEWGLAFDFVLDASIPKQSKNIRQPHYTHQTGVYLTRRGARSIFDRKRRQRSDAFEANGYWPTIFHAPRDRMQENGYAKNLGAITDLLGSFAARHVVDPFVGSGTTLMAAIELDMRATGVENDVAAFEVLKKTVRFMGSALMHGLEIIE